MAKNLNRHISIASRRQKSPALIASEGNKMQVAEAGDAFESVRHRENQKNGAHPCKNRKGRPPKNNSQFMFIAMLYRLPAFRENPLHERSCAIRQDRDEEQNPEHLAILKQEVEKWNET